MLCSAMHCQCKTTTGALQRENQPVPMTTAVHRWPSLGLNPARALAIVRSGGEACIGWALYRTASMFNHSCCPNSEWFMERSGALRVVSLVPLKAGDAVTISYLDLGLGRAARQARLQSAYNFSCECARCAHESDEGELETKPDDQASGAALSTRIGCWVEGVHHIQFCLAACVVDDHSQP
eukprot:SAG11_NODE_3382_length_2485_cov_1.076278_2_plen_181_part_00